MRFLPIALLLWSAPVGATLSVGMDGPFAPSTSATNYAGVIGTSSWSATETTRQALVPIAGKYVQFCATGSADPANGAGVQSYTLSLRVNAASPSDALSLTFTEGYTPSTLQCAAGSTAIAASDLVSVRSVPANTPTASTFRWFALFSSTTDGESFISGGSGATSLDGPNNTTEYFPIGSRNQPSTTQSEYEQVIPAAGTLDTFVCILTAPASTGDTYTFALMVNESASALTCAISGASAVTCTPDADDVAVVLGDRVDVRSVPTSNPDAVRVTCGARFVATATDEFLLLGGSNGAPSASATRYYRLLNAGLAPNATETNVDTLVAPISVRAIAVWLDATLSGGKSYAITLRESTASQDTTVTISGAQSGSALRQSQLPLGGLAAMQVVPSGTPETPTIHISVSAIVPAVYLNGATLQGAVLQ